jgi:anti-sigma factor RsiW
MTCRETELLLHARLDNELDAASLITVDRHLEECRACAAQYAALTSLRGELRTARLDYALPPRLEKKIAARFLRLNSFRSSYPAFAVAALCILAIAALPLLRSSKQPNAIAAEILDDHLRALEPGHLYDVPSSDQHTIKPWFQGRTTFSPPVPDLSNDGFILAGGRLDIINQQRAAVLVYRRRQHVIDLYVAPSTDADAAPKLTDLNGYHLLHWTQSHLTFWAVSDVAPADLRDFAGLITPLN